MEYRNLDVTLISASKLKETNKFRKIHVYATAKIRGCPNSKNKTKPDKDGGINPVFNHQMRFVIDEPSLKPAPPGCGLALVVKLKAEVAGRPRPKKKGEVYVPIHQLFDDCGSTAGVERLMDYEVRKKSGNIRGSLKVSYTFGEKYRRHDVKPEDLASIACPTSTTNLLGTSPGMSPSMSSYPHQPQRKYSPPPSPNTYGSRGGHAPGNMFFGAGQMDGA